MGVGIGRPGCYCEPMANFYCIYSGQICPDETRSLEHIIPYSLGGSDGFATRDVSRAANNNVGTQVDGALINNFFMQHERWSRAIGSADGRVPPIEFRGTVDIQGKPVHGTFVIHPDRRTEVRLVPEVKSDWKELKFSVSCDPGDLPRIAADIERKGKSKGFSFKLLDHAKQGEAITIQQPTMSSGFKFDITSMMPGFVKIALGAGHWVLGYGWSATAHAGSLRGVINSPEPIDWTKHRIHGSAWPQTDQQGTLLNQLLSAGPDRHVVMLSNQNPLGCFILLFGKYDATIQLAPGVWECDELPAGKARIIVVDSRTRQLWTFELGEYLAKKQQGALPFAG